MPWAIKEDVEECYISNAFNTYQLMSQWVNTRHDCSICFSNNSVRENLHKFQLMVMDYQQKRPQSIELHDGVINASEHKSLNYNNFILPWTTRIIRGQYVIDIICRTLLKTAYIHVVRSAYWGRGVNICVSLLGHHWFRYHRVRVGMNK